MLMQKHKDLFQLFNNIFLRYPEHSYKQGWSAKFRKFQFARAGLGLKNGMESEFPIHSTWNEDTL